jgi:Na(+)-translocating NADH:ubiquinone oxidoreductase A subunit
MRLKKGYDVHLAGRPSGKVMVPPEPAELHLPLRSRRFSFTETCVTDGESVPTGHILARDPENYSVPLLAPRAGTVRLGVATNHITLANIARHPIEAFHRPDTVQAHIPKDMGSRGMKRYKLRELGAWQFMQEAFSGAVPDPFGTPRALIVSTLQLEPFMARGDVQLYKRLDRFTRGLEHLQELMEYQPIYLVLPDIESKLAARVRDTLRGHAFVTMVQVPLRYPLDHFALIARMLGLGRDDPEPVWAVGVAGVLAVDRTLTTSRPATVRIITVGGPAAESPQHIKAMPGYPLRQILEAHLPEAPSRVLNGGALTGESVPPAQLGIDTECEGLTVLQEHAEREFMGFMRPGFGRRSYSKCFLSALRGAFNSQLDTALWGEPRPCVSCGFCEEVCPADIMPHLIHKHLYQDAIEEAETARADLCIGCGLCAFVCPSKIELRAEMLGAQETIRVELHGEEAPV